MTGNYIKCPDSEEICKNGYTCPDDCNSNGRCLKSGMCWCYYGYKGVSCSEKLTGELLDKQFKIIDASILIARVLDLAIILVFVVIMALADF